MAYGAASKPDEGYAKRISVLINPEGKVAKIYSKVDVKNHPDQVLQDIP